jgi:hypothetical protein
MRTEEGLRAALTARADLAPDPLTVISTTRRLAARRRRRVAGAAAAAVAVVTALPLALVWGTWAGTGPAVTGSAATTTAPAVAATSTFSRPVAPAVRSPFAFTVASTVVAGYEIRPIAVSPDLQIAQIGAAGTDRPRATLYVYRPGSTVEAAAVPRTEPMDTTVHQVPARVWVTAEISAIEWAYTPGGRAAIVTEPGAALDATTLTGLAQGVGFTAEYPARVPYRLAYLPAGLRPFNVVQRTANGSAPESVVQLETDGRAIDITIRDGSANTRPAWHPTLTMAGHPAQCTKLVDGRRCAVDFGEFTVDIGGGDLRPEEAQRIVAGMTLANWRKPDTWYALDVALPGK